MGIKIKKISESATMPTKAHESDACFDLYADLRYQDYIAIPPHETRMIPAGIATEIPYGYCAMIYARSGTATKKNLRPSNCVGIIDADYRGEWKLCLHNDCDSTRYVSHGERIMQFMIIPILDVELQESEELNETDRGVGGFGSSGRF